MRKFLAIWITAGGLFVRILSAAQDTANQASKPTEHVMGTVSAVDPAAHTVTVKEDKSGTEYIIQLQNTRTLLKVDPSAKDLKNATRITGDDLAIGDRVDIRGSKLENNPNGIGARSVILMSGRDLQQAHQAQAAAWQRSTPGVVTSVDSATQKLNITARTPQGPKPVTVDAAKAEFTRYSPQTPQTPVNSQLSDIQAGDQVRIIGESSPDGGAITAQKIYSNSFRTLVGTVSAIAADGKQLTLKDLQTKQTVSVSLTDASAVHKLPQPMAYMLARRFNPDFKSPQGSGNPDTSNASSEESGSGAPAYGAKSGEAGASNQPPGANRPWRGNAGGGEGGPGARPDSSGIPTANGAGPGLRGGPGGNMHSANGDLSQLLDRLPKISLTDLKPGDAVVVSGSPQGSDRSRLIATNIIAGVEPIFQSASPRQAQSLGNWGASLSGEGMDTGAGLPGGPPQ